MPSVKLSAMSLEQKCIMDVSKKLENPNTIPSTYPVPFHSHRISRSGQFLHTSQQALHNEQGNRNRPRFHGHGCHKAQARHRDGDSLPHYSFDQPLALNGNTAKHNTMQYSNQHRPTNRMSHSHKPIRTINLRTQPGRQRDGGKRPH